MHKDELFKVIEILEGPNHHSRNELLLRNGCWGDCADCPRVLGVVYPEECQNYQRYDHHLNVAPKTLAIIHEFKYSLTHVPRSTKK